MMHIHFLCMFINSIYVICFFLVFEISKANIMKFQISNISELFSGFKVHVKLAFLGQWHSATSVQCSDSGDYSRLKLQKDRLKIFFAVNLFVSCVCVCVGFLVSSALQRDGVLSPHLPLHSLPILAPLSLCSIFNGMARVWWEGTWGCRPCPLMWSVSPISPSVCGPFKTDLEWGIKESHWCFPWSGDWEPKWYPTPRGPVPLWN